MAAATSTSKRVLLGGVGYRYLRDLSVGPALVERLRQQEWPEWVEIEDLSVGPIHLVQRFEEEPGRYGRVVLAGAVIRGREPGTITCYRWQGELPDADEIQARIGEAVTGVISLDNLLVISAYFKVWPDDVIVIEVEPDDLGWGDGFTPRVDAALDAVVVMARDAALEGAHARV